MTNNARKNKSAASKSERRFLDRVEKRKLAKISDADKKAATKKMQEGLNKLNKA